MTTGTAGTTARQDPRQVSNTLKRTLNWNDADIALAKFDNLLPMGAVITDILVEIITPFNAGTTNPITVGTVAATYNNLANGAGVGTDFDPTVVGVTKPTRGLGQGAANAADVQPYMTYIPTGAAATAGKAQVTIIYEGGWVS